jgi:murein L,D-transpeptidase YcbB/YkuD
MKKLFLIAFLATRIYAFVDINPSCCTQEILEETNNVNLKNYSKVTTFYKKHMQKLHWDSQDLNDLLNAIKNPMINYLYLDFNQDEIEELAESVDIYDEIEQKRIYAKIDLLATDAFFSFSKFISVGLIDLDRFQASLKESEVDLVWEKNPKVFHYGDDLNLALKSNMLEVLFQRYLPLEDEYKKLVQAYHRYSNITFPVVDYGKLMKVGDYGYRASQLKYFLVATGDFQKMDKDYMEFPTFDDKLSTALKRFQKRHYLKETGELDRVTVLYTRKSAAKKQELVKLNIERHKLFPKIYDGEYILINIPEFSLKYFQNRTQIADIFVVIGREDRPTPTAAVD